MKRRKTSGDESGNQLKKIMYNQTTAFAQEMKQDCSLLESVNETITQVLSFAESATKQEAKEGQRRILLLQSVQHRLSQADTVINGVVHKKPINIEHLKNQNTQWIETTKNWKTISITIQQATTNK